MLRRLVAAALFVALSTLAVAGLEIGATPARGPGGTMSSELVVDGGRTPSGTSTSRRTQRPPRTRETDEERLEEDVATVAPTARAVSVNLARTALHGVTGAAKAALAELERRWRGRLAEGNGG